LHPDGGVIDRPVLSWLGARGVPGKRTADVADQEPLVLEGVSRRQLLEPPERRLQPLETTFTRSGRHVMAIPRMPGPNRALRGSAASSKTGVLERG
jgi:hypothetical protein